MSDKATVATNALPAVPVIPVGGFFGFDPVTMVVGFVSALIAIMHVHPEEGEVRTPFMVFLLVAGSAFLAGIFAPVTIAGAIHYFPWLKTVDSHGLRLASAGIIGALPHLIPLLWRTYRQHKGAQQ